MSETWITQCFTVERAKFETEDLTRAVVNMPDDFEFISVVPVEARNSDEQGFGLLVRCKVNAVRVPHALRVIPYQMPFEVLDGIVVKQLGITPGPRGPATIFAELRPRTALDAVQPEGRA